MFCTRVLMGLRDFLECGTVHHWTVRVTGTLSYDGNQALQLLGTSMNRIQVGPDVNSITLTFTAEAKGLLLCWWSNWLRSTSTLPQARVKTPPGHEHLRYKQKMTDWPLERRLLAHSHICLEGQRHHDYQMRYWHYKTWRQVQTNANTYPAQSLTLTLKLKDTGNLRP